VSSALDGPRRPTIPDRVDGWVRRHVWAGDLVFAAAVALVGTASFGAYPVGDSGWVYLLVMHGALVFRRSFPIASFLAVTAAHALQVSEIATPLPSNLVFPLSLYALTAYARQPWPVVGLLVGLLGALVGAVRFSDGYGVGPIDVVLAMLLGTSVVAAWALGSFKRVRSRYVEALQERAHRAELEREERARRAVTEERARVAREMHDIVAHSLAVVVVQAQSGAFAARTDPQKAIPVLDTISATARDALADMRSLLGVLREGTDAAGGNGGEPTGVPAEPAPQPGLEDLEALVARVRAAGLAVSCEQHGEPVALSATAALAVYRVVQESLTNTLKHGGPGATARVVLDWGDAGLVVTAEDDGYGQAPPREDAGGHDGHGLVGMRERMTMFGGSLETGPRPGGGFRVRARLPFTGGTATATAAASRRERA
jgi:signal transduction histidine kinase